jgi:rhamnose utilization protein RhaD (predicted bifunctional aldolase and dehydrogenase)
MSWVYQESYTSDKHAVECTQNQTVAQRVPDIGVEATVCEMVPEVLIYDVHADDFVNLPSSSER